MDKQLMIKHILKHLDENELVEVKDKLEKESGMKCEMQKIHQVKALIKEDKVDESISLLKDGSNILDILALSKLIFYKIKLLTNQGENFQVIKLIREYVEYLENYQRSSQFSNTNQELVSAELRKFKQFTPSLFTKKDINKENVNEMKQNLMKQINCLFYGEKSLKGIIDDVVSFEHKKCKFHNLQEETYSYLYDHQCKLNRIPYNLLLTIDQNQEVLDVVLSNTGRYFAALLKENDIAVYVLESSDERSIEVTLLMTIAAPHSNQITSIQWNKEDSLILTSSKDKLIKLINPFTGKTKLSIDCHSSMVTSAIFVQDYTKILSSGLDYKVCLSSLSGSLEFSVSIPNVTISQLMYSYTINMIIIVSATTNSLIFYDLNTRSEIDKLQMNDVIISCSISKMDSGEYIIVNSSKATPVITLIRLKDRKLVQKYFGHRQERFSVKCSLGGYVENFIVCGSEDGSVCVWNRNYSKSVSETKLHSSQVNSVIMTSNMIISCSDDHTIKFLGNADIDKIFLGYENKKENRYGLNSTNVANESMSLLSRINSIIMRTFQEENDE